MKTLNKKQGTWGLSLYFVYPLLCLAGIGLAGPTLVSCRAFSPVMAVTVSLPAFPVAWSGAEAWELDWRSLDTLGETRLACPGETLVLFLPRTSSAAIRCKPVFGTARGWPYGAIWPLQVDAEGAILLSPGGGLSAELAFRLYQAGYEAENFNLIRFAAEAELRISDPWESDLPGLARAAVEGRFRSDYLKTPARTQLVVLGVSGVMAPASPWGTVLQPDPQGQVVLTAPVGVHRWFGVDQELVVSIPSAGSPEWLLRGAKGRVREKVLP